MTLKERDAIERYDDEPRFVPSFASRFRVMKGVCAGCFLPLNDHWLKLHGDQEGWVGCPEAQKKEIARLRRALGERDSRLRGEFLGRDSDTPAVESRVDGDAA